MAAIAAEKAASSIPGGIPSEPNSTGIAQSTNVDASKEKKQKKEK